MLARATTHALVGLDPRQVEIEAHLRGGLKAFTIVGLADRAVQEAKERVVSAVRSAELFWPDGRVIVNLAPAELRKEGSAFDLPIALAVLAASGQVPRTRLAEHASIGELALDGRIRRVGGVFGAIVTSPPYPGLIDYHEQHRYAYELLELDDLRDLELGAAADGTNRAALGAYSDGIAATLANAGESLSPGAPVLIVVNDRRDLYPEILDRAGLRIESRLRRHVNRRTGRRAGEFFEDVIVARVS